jgi:plasmid rolling circle replication initiator protein Rep
MKIALDDRSKTGKKRNWQGLKILSRQVSMLYGILALKYRETDAGLWERFDKRAKLLYDCASKLVFKSCTCGQTTKLFRAHFCRARLCSVCSWRKSLVVFHQALQICHHVLEKMPGLRFLFMTLTVENCSGADLRKTFKDMAKGYQELLRLKCFSPVKGSFRSFDVTYNPLRRDFHLHLHIILCVLAAYFDGHYYMSVKKLQAAWRKVMKLDYDPVVWIAAVKPKDDESPTDYEILVDTEIKEKGLIGAVAETAKYSVSIGHLFAPYNRKDDAPTAAARLALSKDPKWQAEVIEALDRGLHGCKLSHHTGIMLQVFREQKMQSVESSDLVHVEENVTPCTCPACQSTLSQQTVFAWNRDKQNYFQIKGIEK